MIIHWLGTKSKHTVAGYILASAPLEEAHGWCSKYGWDPSFPAKWIQYHPSELISLPIDQCGSQISEKLPCAVDSGHRRNPTWFNYEEWASMASSATNGLATPSPSFPKLPQAPGPSAKRGWKMVRTKNQRSGGLEQNIILWTWPDHCNHELTCAYTHKIKLVNLKGRDPLSP